MQMDDPRLDMANTVAVQLDLKSLWHFFGNLFNVFLKLRLIHTTVAIPVSINKYPYLTTGGVGE